MLKNILIVAIMFVLLLPISCDQEKAECENNKEKNIQFATAFCLVLSNQYSQTTYRIDFISCWLEFGGLASLENCKNSSSSSDDE